MRLYSTIEPWGPDSIPWMENYKEKIEATWHLTATFLEYTYTNTHVIKLKSCKKIAKQPNQNIQGFAKRELTFNTIKPLHVNNSIFN